MTAYLHDLGPALSAELLKTKRTLVLALAFVAPAAVVMLNELIYWQRGSTMGPSGRDIWSSLTQNNLIFWSLLALPLFVTLQTALLAGLEHSGKNWKHIFALPVSRGAIYTAKQLVAMGMIGLSSLVLWVGIMLSGLSLRVIQPGIGLEAPVPVWKIFQTVALVYVASWLIIAVHAWIGMRWSSFAVAMTVGVVATIAAVVVVQSDWPLYYPWTLPGAVAMDALEKGVIAYGWLALGALGGIVGAILGGVEFTHRDVL